MAMAGGGFHSPFLTAAWPTGEFGGMGLEGAVQLGFRRELEAVEDQREREALYQRLVAQAYEKGQALNMASHFEIDAVIDPLHTRQWILGALRSLPASTTAKPERRPSLDPW
jgi:acetyl-CoA carboxylase carboxyltransferase component